ncbi:TspO/MBR-like protein [Panus rudis PR-1116 ss-1]|nr:TspO/MBR-like protein [Panus rudis PR-1116 ss-1]
MIELPALFYDIPRNPVTAVGLPLTLGLLLGAPTRRVVRGQWYNGLQQPPGTPPRAAFPIVWSALYIGMGYASHLAVNAYDNAAFGSTANTLNKALILYYAQLSLNFAWTPLFFLKRKVGLALIDIMALTGTTTYMTVILHRATQGKTTYFLLPYCAWLCYATYLNAGIWGLNPGNI